MALPCPPFGKSDHDSILLLPSYRQKLKQEVPVVRTAQHWSDQSESMLQDCFDHVDWDMLQVASENNIDIYTDMVTEFIRKCIVDVIPTVTIKTYPNQKPWIDGSIRTKLKARTTAFNHGKVTGNMVEYKQCSYSLRKAITGKTSVQRQSGVVIQRRRHETNVVGSTDNHGLQRENLPHCGRLAPGQAKHLHTL